MKPDALCQMRVTNDYRANQNANTNTLLCRPKDTYEHKLEQIIRHIRTHSRPSQKTYTSTP